MSLDVYLEVAVPIGRPGTGVFVRDNGANRELTVEEVSLRWPGSTVTEQEYRTNEVFSANITHNLNKMALAAGLYEALWRPDENGLDKAADLIPLLEAGLGTLQDNPEHFRLYSPRNGWGSYAALREFVIEYLDACREYPEAKVTVSR